MASKSSKTTISLTITILFLIISFVESQLIPTPPPSPTNNDDFGTCPRNPLQLGVCANVLGLANVVAGDTRARPCCRVVNGLADVQVADCLCFVFRPIPLVFDIDKAVREIFFACNMVFPIGFQCPPHQDLKISFDKSHVV